MAPLIRQTRGPGMNRGLKKPRKKPKEPEDYKPPREKKLTLAEAASGSYLPGVGDGGKPRRRRGKTPSNMF